MADFDFVGPSYETASIYQDAQECINFYPEIDILKQPGSRGVVALYPTPGLLDNSNAAVNPSNISITLTSASSTALQSWA